MINRENYTKDYVALLKRLSAPSVAYLTLAFRKLVLVMLRSCILLPSIYAHESSAYFQQRSAPDSNLLMSI